MKNPQAASTTTDTTRSTHAELSSIKWRIGGSGAMSKRNVDIFTNN
jgi:hypothetical protein